MGYLFMLSLSSHSHSIIIETVGAISCPSSKISKKVSCNPEPVKYRT